MRRLPVADGLRRDASAGFIPAGNEPSAVLARAFMTIELVLLYGKCREGHNTKVSKGHLQLCCASSLIPRQLAAGYLIPAALVLHGLERNADRNMNVQKAAQK